MTLQFIYQCHIPSNQHITSLPLTLGLLPKCSDIILDGISITNVPRELLPGNDHGSTRHLLAYLRAKLRHSVPYNRMKLMVVGLQGRGKTTLISVLRSPNSPLPENVSTVGVVVKDWVLQPPPPVGKKKNTVKVNCFDHTVFLRFPGFNIIFISIWFLETCPEGGVAGLTYV